MSPLVLVMPAYGEVELPSDRMPLREALLRTLHTMRDMFQAGFVVDGSSVRRRPDQEWVDCNFETAIVLEFIRTINGAAFDRQHK